MQNTEDSTNTSSENTGQETAEPKPRPKSKSLANTIRKGTNMASGINEHLGVLSPRGLDETTIQNINTLVEQCGGIDNDQEIHKGKLKEKTAELQVKVRELKDVLSQCAQIIKAVIPQERWVDFGISAKK